MKDDHIQIEDKLSTNPLRVPRLNGEYPQSFIDFLKIVYTGEEAAVVKFLNPIPGFVTSDDIAEKTGIELDEVQKRLDRVRLKNACMGMGNMFCLPPIPILLNIHHFYTDIKENDLASIPVYRDFFIDKGYSRYYETSEAGTPVFRAIPIEESIRCGQKTLKAEEAHAFIRESETDDLVLTACPCRTRAEKAGDRECKDKFPIASCIMMGMAAVHFESIGVGKRVSKDQALEYLDEMNKIGMIACTENAETQNTIICMCCECCCSQVRGITRWDNPESIAPSNFIPVTTEDCIGCGLCAKRCFFGALEVDKETKTVKVEPDKCLGCGVCTFACKNDALRLERLERSTPFASVGKLMKAFNTENKKIDI